MIKKLVIAYYYSFILSPLFAYLMWTRFELRIYPFYGIIAILLAILSLFDLKIKVPLYIKLYILLGIYYLIWDFSDGYIESIGIFKYFYRSVVPFIIANLVLIENYTVDYNFIENFKKIFKITAILAVIFSFIQVFINRFFFVPDYRLFYGIEYMTQMEMRNASIFYYVDPNEVGFTFVPLVLIFIGIFLKEKLKIKYFYLIISLFVIIVTNSRYIQISSFFIIGLLLLHSRRKINNTLKIAFTVVILFISAYYILSSQNYSFADYQEQRLESNTFIDRVNAFRNFWGYFSKSMIIGTGYELTFYDSNTGKGFPLLHVGYLSHTVAFGIIGSSLLYSIWILVLIRFYKTAKKTEYYGSYYAVLFFLFAILTLPRNDFYSYGMLYAFIIDKYYFSEKKENESVNNNLIKGT